MKRNRILALAAGALGLLLPPAITFALHLPMIAAVLLGLAIGYAGGLAATVLWMLDE